MDAESQSLSAAEQSESAERSAACFCLLRLSVYTSVCLETDAADDEFAQGLPCFLPRLDPRVSVSVGQVVPQVGVCIVLINVPQWESDAARNVASQFVYAPQRAIRQSIIESPSFPAKELTWICGRPFVHLWNLFPKWLGRQLKRKGA